MCLQAFTSRNQHFIILYLVDFFFFFFLNVFQVSITHYEDNIKVKLEIQTSLLH